MEGEDDEVGAVVTPRKAWATRTDLEGIKRFKDHGLTGGLRTLHGKRRLRNGARRAMMQEPRRTTDQRGNKRAM